MKPYNDAEPNLILTLESIMLIIRNNKSICGTVFELIMIGYC